MSPYDPAVDPLSTEFIPPRWTSEGRRWILPHIDGDDTDAAVLMLSGSEDDPRPVVMVMVLGVDRVDLEAPADPGDDEVVPTFAGFIDPQQLADMLASHGFVGVARELPS